MQKQPSQANDIESKSHSEEAKHEIIQIYQSESSNIVPKYANLKSEILALNSITDNQYQRTYNKAKRFHESFAMHKYVTPSDGSLENPLLNIAESWEKGARISVDELFVLYLVVDFNVVQCIFRKCTEQLLPHIFHLRRQLFIVVNKYGSQHFGKNDKLYLPVHDEITTMGPLLVTSSLKVSEIIASKTKQGISLTIMPQTNQWKAFDATNLPTIDPFKQQWLIDFEYLPMIQINPPYHQSSLPICEI